MLVRGRRLDPRRILRYLFQELLAPWIQLKRCWLRVEWFFTTPIHIGPMWTSSVVCGLIGVMLTILLFKGPSKLEASTKAIADVSQPTPLFAPPPATIPVPLFAPLTLEMPFDSRLVRMTLPPYWDQATQSTLVSTSPDLINHHVVQPIRDGWNVAHRQVAESLPSIYRKTATLWDANRVAPAVLPSDRPAQYVAGESHPFLVVTRDIPAQVSPSQPVTYSLVVQNRGAEILEQILVTEEPANLDHVQETFPPAEVSATALHWRIDELRPGQDRRLAITLAPGSEREIQALAEVRTTVAVSSSTKVAAAAPPPVAVTETPQVVQETPRLSPVQPVSQEEVPRAPRLSVVAEIANTLKVDDELSTVFVVSNTGNGDADGVVLTVEVPAELEHRDGALVEHHYAQIPAGTTKRAIFKALARTPGSARVNAALTMDGARVADWATQIQIAAKPMATTPTSPSIASPLSGGAGPAPEDGPRRPASPFPTMTRPANPGLSIPIGAPNAGGAPSMQPQVPSGPVNSSIPLNRRPIANPTGGGLPGQAPNGALPGSSLPGGGQVPGPAPTSPGPGPNQPSPKDDAPEGTNFVSVPRRHDPGAVMGWKRVLGR